MTVEAILRCGGVFRTAPLYQYDEGQMIHLTGITLPASYLAEFANSEIGAAEQVAQTTDTVTVPDKYLTSGSPVYVWIVVVGEDERTTRYEIIVPVRGRGEPDDYTPTPEEQTAIEAAIAALNSAVEAAGVAIEHYPRITDGVWQVWDVTAGEWVSTEVPAQGPQGETGATGNGIASAVLNADYTLTLTFTNGTTYTTPSIRGAQGDPGPAGQDGADGYSPTATVSKSGGVATITITDKNGTTTAQVSDGATGQTGPAGADGYSPTASVSKSGSTATISITDKQGTTTAQVSDGAPGPGVPAGGTTGQMLVKKSDTDYDGKWANPPSVPVQDVQVNGTSILSNGVANVPIAGENTFGALKVYNGTHGLGVWDTGILHTDPAGDAQIRAGNNAYKCVNTYSQHKSVFYGLAKAAGADMASSSNAVGNYTESAKKAICAMIGVKYDAPFRLITERSISAETGSIYVTSDDAGNPFSLTEMLVLFDRVLVTQGGYCSISVNSGNNTRPSGPYLTVQGMQSSVAQNRAASIKVIGGRMFGDVNGANLTSDYEMSQLSANMNARGKYTCEAIQEFCIGPMNDFKFASGTITVYGR